MRYESIGMHALGHSIKYSLGPLPAREDTRRFGSSPDFPEGPFQAVSCADLLPQRFEERVIPQAVDKNGMTDMLIEERTVLLSGNEAGYISQRFNEYLRLVGIRHITVLTFHP